MGYPSAIGTPDAVIFYAGSAPEFEAVQPLLAALSGDPVYVGEDPGHPATIDGALIINMMSIYVANMVGRAMCAADLHTERSNADTATTASRPSTTLSQPAGLDNRDRRGPSGRRGGVQIRVNTCGRPEEAR